MYTSTKLDEQTKEKIRNGYAVDLTTTQDELDYSLKAQLKHITPEQRYQQEKEHFHELSYLKQTVDKNTGKALDIIKEYGCGHPDNERGCVPEYRFYLKYGRIEDEEVIEEHNKWVEFYRQKNAIVEPPDMNSREAHEFFEQHPFLRRR